MIGTVEDLDKATWPMICRPADVFIRRLAEAPWCPKCFSKTTKAMLADWGMCSRCRQVWYFQPVLLEDVRIKHVIFIRHMNWAGRYDQRAKAATSPQLDAIARELNRKPKRDIDVDYRVEGKTWTLPLVAYIITNRDFMPCRFVYLPGKKSHSTTNLPKGFPHDYHPYPLRNEEGVVICRRCPLEMGEEAA